MQSLDNFSSIPEPTFQYKAIVVKIAGAWVNCGASLTFQDSLFMLGVVANCTRNVLELIERTNVDVLCERLGCNIFTPNSVAYCFGMASNVPHLLTCFPGL